MIRLFLFSIILCYAAILPGQEELSNLQKTKIAIQEDWQKLDSLTLVPGSILLITTTKDTIKGLELLEVLEAA